MNKQTFLKLEKLSHEVANTEGLGFRTISHSSGFFDELDGKISQDPAVKTETEETPQPPIGHLVRGKTYILPDRAESRIRISDSAEKHTNTLLKATRPAFWDSWAHKSTHRSFAVENYFVHNYVKTEINKTFKRLLHMTREISLSDSIKIKPHTSNVYLLNKTHPGILRAVTVFTNTNDSTSLFSVLRDIWISPKMKITTGNNELEVLFESELVATKDIDFMFMDWLDKILLQTQSHVVSNKAFNLYVLDPITVLMLVMYSRFPITYNLHQDVAFLAAVLDKTVRYCGYDIDTNSSICAYFVPKTPLVRTLFREQEFTVLERRHMCGPIPCDLKKEKKPTNKDFFDYERLLRTDPIDKPLARCIDNNLLNL